MNILDGIQSVIFDLDGTLVDSMWMWRQIDIEFLGEFGISLPKTLQDEIEGMSFTETAQYFAKRFPQIHYTEEQMKQHWNEMAYEKYANEVTLKPGIEQFLEYLKQNHISMGVGTSNSHELVTTALKSCKIEHYFSSVHTACEVAKGKPAPDIYELVAKDLGTLPEHCLVFEDIPAGIMAGKNAGMRTCAVQDEYSRHLQEEKIKLADYFIEQYGELIPKKR